VIELFPGEKAITLYVVSQFDPGVEAAGQLQDVPVTHLLQGKRGEEGAHAFLAVKKDGRAFVGQEVACVHLHFIRPDEHRALYVARGDLLGFSYIEKCHALTLEQTVRLTSRHFSHFRLCLFQQLTE